MSFGQPGYLALLVVVVAMIAIAVGLARWRTKARASFAGPQAASWRSTVSVAATIFMLEAAALIVLAIALPQWGSTETTRDREGLDMVIVLDISQSMQGTDVEPTRLEAAQQQLARLVEAERGNRFGLVLFAGSAVLRSPLTTDAAAMADLIRRASGEAGLVRGGSDIGAALEQAGIILSTSDENTGKAVLVVSDGEDHAGTFTQQARALRDSNILVLTAGFGTQQGSQLYDFNRLGNPVLKVDAGGAPVVTRLDETNLRAVAEAGGGRYLRVSGDTNVLSFREDLSRLARSPLGAETSSIPVQRFQVFTAAALLLLVASWFVPMRVGSLNVLARRLRPRLRAEPGIAMVLLALFIGACGSNDSLRSLNQAANEDYERGSYQEALEQYQRLIAQRPDVPELSVNAGNALHRAQSYERAVQETRRVLPTNDPLVGAVTYYSLGNHYFMLEEYELAYDAYRNALMLDPADQDAKYNLELTFLILTGQTDPESPQAGQQPGDPNGEPGGEGDPSQQPPEPGEQGEGEAEEPGEPGEVTEPGEQAGPSTNPPTQDVPGAEVRRALEEALRGLDQGVSIEEAMRILDLLEETQSGDRVPGRGVTPTGPDY